MTIWDTLGVAVDCDRDTVRRAYARKLRQTHPEDDPEGFKTLREAYERALARIDHVAQWGEDAGDDDEAEAEDEDAAPPAPVFHSEPVSTPTPPGGPEPGEISALLAAREAERAALHAAMRGLDQALRGTWRASDDELEALFNDILHAPALGEIAMRDEVETWAAELIAATIPRSDAILLQAVTRFGWTTDPHRPSTPAVDACLGRIDEWRIIQELNHYRHRLHSAWRSLTRPAGAWWSWRLDAFQPGVPTGVETLLGRRGPVAPGLHHSFKADSVARWERLLATPHLTLSMLTAIPGAALLAFILGTSLNPDRTASSPDAIGMWAALAAAVLAPVLLFALHSIRFANDRLGLAGWWRDGWMPAYLLLAALAPVLPVSPWSVAAFALAALAIWGWMTATTTPPTQADIAARVAALWLPATAAAASGLVALLAFPVPPALVLCLMMLLYLLLRFGGWEAGVTGLRRNVARGPWVALATLGALAVPAGCGVLAALGRVRGYVWFDAAALLLLGALPLLAALRDTARPEIAKGVAVVRVLLFALLGVAWFATIDSMPTPKPSAPAAPVVITPATDATTTGTLRGDIVAALGAGTTEQALTALAERQPGFGQIADGNPPLYGAIRAALDEGVAGRHTPEATADVVVALLAHSYRERLATTNDDLVREEFRIRLARLRTLQHVSDDACVAPRTQFDETTLYDAARRRQIAQALNVASNAVVDERDGFFVSRLSPAQWDARAAALAGMGVAGYRRALAGTGGSGPQCQAMIARLRVVADDDAPFDPAIVPTMRGELLRERITMPRALE